MGDIVKSTFTLNGAEDREIKGDIYSPNEAGQYPLVIILHGFKGFKEWGFFPYISTEIAQNNAISLCFDFSFNAILDPDNVVYDTEIFAQNSIDKEIYDAQKVLNAVNSGKIKLDNWNGKIYLLGHSLGGAISIITAAKNNSIDKLILWGTISKFDRYTERQKDFWLKSGRMSFKDKESGQELYLSKDYLENILKNEKENKPSKIISKIKCPILILHGDKDITVSLAEAEELESGVLKKELLTFIIIEKTGHLFGIKHPMDKPSRALREVKDHTLKFLELI